MDILITNDDGIASRGIIKLAKLAKAFGNVTVIAPKRQCSAMSQMITLRCDIKVEKEDFPVEGVKAYSITGTPADCIKVGIAYLKLKPDYVFSGINNGYNTGFDIAYSGTVAAGMEAVMNGIPAIAFSVEVDGEFDIIDGYLQDITKKLIERQPLTDGIWNVNFPGSFIGELKGIKWDMEISRIQLYQDNYLEAKREKDCVEIYEKGIKLDIDKIPKDTDLRAVMEGYISVGKIKCMVL